MAKIKSPISQDLVFERKVKRLFEAEKLELAFIFYIPSGDGNAMQFDIGMCSHQLTTLGEAILKTAKEREKIEQNDHN